MLYILINKDLDQGPASLDTVFKLCKFKAFVTTFIVHRINKKKSD